MSCLLLNLSQPAAENARSAMAPRESSRDGREDDPLNPASVWFAVIAPSLLSVRPPCPSRWTPSAAIWFPWFPALRKTRECYRAHGTRAGAPSRGPVRGGPFRSERLGSDDAARDHELEPFLHG